MRAKTISLIVVFFIISMVRVTANAQLTASAVMNVTVEVVDGSSVEMNQNDLITFDEHSPTDFVFAIFSISNNQENSILTSASETIQMMNGLNSVEMMSTFTESIDENSTITLEFSTGFANNFIDGIYSGRQIAEIIYL